MTSALALPSVFIDPQSVTIIKLTIWLIRHHAFWHTVGVVLMWWGILAVAWGVFWYFFLEYGRGPSNRDDD